MIYRVDVTPCEGYWNVRVPGISRSTQARTLDEIDVMARDLIEIMTGEKNAALDVVMTLPGGADKYLHDGKRQELQAA